MGRERAAASAMVPGPALVTRTSVAIMWAAMLVMKPRPITLTRGVGVFGVVSWDGSCALTW